MGLFKWLTVLGTASVVLAVPTPEDSAASSKVSSDTSSSSAAVAALNSSSGDIAASFLSSLINNVTQVTEAQAAGDYTVTESKRGLTCSQSRDLTVTVLYAKYQGYYNATTGLNTWQG
jgi:hypothetical protein